MADLDPLSDILRFLRVGGALVLNDTYPVPWAVDVPNSRRLASVTELGPGHLVAFHLVMGGSLEFTEEDGSRSDAEKGDLLVCFGGQAHRLGNGEAVPVPFEELIGPVSGRRSSHRTDAATTSLLCGIFSLGALYSTPLGDYPLRTVHVRPGDDGELDSLAELLITEVSAQRLGHGFAVGRILELICATAVRQLAETTPTDQPSWLRALADPAVLAAMSAVHADPGWDWNMGALGEVAAMSPSRLTARFRASLGQSPMAYVTAWRMAIAAQLLVDTDLTVQLVAERVGYTAQPSFTRSFTRHHGMSPRSFRTRLAPS